MNYGKYAEFREALRDQANRGRVAPIGGLKMKCTYEFTLTFAVLVRTVRAGRLGRQAGGIGCGAAHAAVCKGFALAGGGGTITAIDKLHVADRIDHMSTTGRAFLEYVDGKKLPALTALKK